MKLSAATGYQWIILQLAKCLLKCLPACVAEDAERALQSSERARRQWALLPPVQRAGYLYRICDGLKAERDHFARLLVMEQGKTLAEAQFEVDDTIRYMTYAAEAARRIQGRNSAC